MTVNRIAIFIFAVALLRTDTFDAVAADSPKASAAERARLQGALEAAQANVFGVNGLDAAYELLAVTDAATRSGAADVATQSGASLLSVIERATASSETAGGSAAQDSIDQLLDLKFSAGSSGLEAIVGAIDIAMQRLMTVAEAAQVATIESNGDWDARIDALTALGDLQASAAQANLAADAERIGRAFDRAFATVSEDAHNVTGSDRVVALNAIRTGRDERLADAASNNVQTVAAELRAAEQSADDDIDLAGASDLDAAMEDSTCVETGLTEASQGRGLEAIERDCMLSGHTTSAARCTTRNLSFVCYKADAGGESLTYVYRGTPEEDDLRIACGTGNILESMSVPVDGAPYRSANTRHALTCAPIGDRADSE